MTGGWLIALPATLPVHFFEPGSEAAICGYVPPTGWELEPAPCADTWGPDDGPPPHPCPGCVARLVQSLLGVSS